MGVPLGGMPEVENEGMSTPCLAQCQEILDAVM